jgi:hypothetical protein
MRAATTYDLQTYVDDAWSFLTNNHFQLFGARLPLWVAAVALGLFVHWLFNGREPAAGTLSYPYYIDQDGLRSIAGALKIDLPVSRAVMKGRGLGFGFKSVTSRFERNETLNLAGAIDLDELARGVASRAKLGNACEINLEASNQGKTQTNLRMAAQTGALLIVRGVFAVQSGGEEPLQIIVTSARDDLEVLLPDADALTRSGAERLRDPEPFYGEIIAHSARLASGAPSGDRVRAIAYAVWGRSRS